MTISVFAALPIALAGSAFLSLGMVLQKKHVYWFEALRQKKPFLRDMGFWMLGFLFMNLQPIFLYLSLFGLPPAVAAATNGASVTFTALFSAPLLGEKITRRRLAWSALLFAAIAVAALTSPQSGEADADFSGIFVFGALLLPLVMAWALARWGGSGGAPVSEPRAGRASGAGFPDPEPAGPASRALGEIAFATAMGAASGALGGFMVLPMRILQGAGLSLGAWFATPWIYLYVLAGISAFVYSQKAYARGSLGQVAPAFYGMQVLWPAIASYAVFGAAFLPLQAAAFALIALAVYGSARSS